MKLTPDKLTNLFNLVVEERKNKLEKNQVKENWLIAWSLFRLTYKNTGQKKPRKIRESIDNLMPIAYKCFAVREDADLHYPNWKCDLGIYLSHKGYKKEWTGWKNTWVKIEEKDVPF